MKTFYRAYERLKLADGQHVVRRDLMDKVDLADRLICIRGTRGVGKTRFLLDFAKEHWGADDSLYVNMNHFYFSMYSLTDFARNFVTHGGRVLILDQIFKYPEWVRDLELIYKELTSLTVIFSTSSVMTPEEDFGALRDIIKVYDIQGFSFREYLNFHSGLDFNIIPIEEILKHHEYYTSQILNQLQPLDYFTKYLTQGYYPPEMDKTLFGEVLVKNLNMLMEVDIVYIRQIDPSYLHKLRQLLYIIGTDENAKPNITKLSESIGASRATVMNYLRYLSDAGMIRMLYKSGGTSPRKPDAVYINDTNIMSVLYPNEPSKEVKRKVFLLSHLQNAGLTVEIPEVSSVDFQVEGKYRIKTLEQVNRRSRGDFYYAIENIVMGKESRIPLWLFGFLY